jgi:hypothetical protein
MPRIGGPEKSGLSTKLLNLHWINSEPRVRRELARFVNIDLHPPANDDRGFPISPSDGPQQSR